MIIIPPKTPIHTLFHNMAHTRRMVFFVGLPGVGKSLLLQQFALMAQQAGRTVHLLQWDVTRSAFETAANLAKYPEIDGVTHAFMRKAVGVWARQAVARWQQQYPQPQHLLVGELPLIGNRLIELVQPHTDDAERLLSDKQSTFVLPVPSREVRQAIEAARAQTIAQPQHQKETKDAQPHVLRSLWQEMAELAAKLNLAEAANSEYDPAVVTAVYHHLLQHRHVETLPIDIRLQPTGSVYELDIIATELAATPAEVQEVMSTIEQAWTVDEVETAVQNWHTI